MSAEVGQHKGPPIVVDEDLFPRPDTTIEKLAKLKPIYVDPSVLHLADQQLLIVGYLPQMFMISSWVREKKWIVSARGRIYRKTR